LKTMRAALAALVLIVLSPSPAKPDAEGIAGVLERIRQLHGKMDFRAEGRLVNVDAAGRGPAIAWH